MATRAQLLRARRYVASFPKEEQEFFKKKYESLNEADQDIAIENLMGQIDSEVQEQRKIFKNKGVPSGFDTLESVGQALTREEAAVADPLLSLIRRAKPRLGEEIEPGSSLQDFSRGAKGLSFSPRSEGRQAEFGDVIEEAGQRFLGVDVPDPVSAAGGLILTEFLPSSQALGRSVGRAGVKKAAKAVPAVRKGLSDVANNFVNLFKNIESRATGGRRAAAEAFELLLDFGGKKGEGSDAILYAFENPDILTKSNARPEVPGEIAQMIAQKTKKVLAKQPNLFGADEEVPLEIAKNMIENFDEVVDTAGQAVKLTKKQFGADARRVRILEINRALKKQLKRFERDGKVRPGLGDNPTYQGLKEIQGKVKEIGSNKFGLLNLDDLEDIKLVVREEAFKRGGISPTGIALPDPELNRASKQIYGAITRSVKRNYPDEVSETFSRFSDLADKRARLSKKFGTSEKLAGFLRKIDRKNPEQLNELSELIQEIPDGQRFINDLNQFLDLKAGSLSEQLPFITERSEKDVAKGFERLFKQDFTTIPDTQKAALADLEKAIDTPFLKPYIDHIIASKFAKKTNFLRMGAVGSGPGSLVMAGLAPFLGGFGALAAAAPIGLLSGFALTDPRFVGQTIETIGEVTKSKTGRAILDTLLKTGKKAIRPVGRRLLKRDEPVPRSLLPVFEGFEEEN